MIHKNPKLSIIIISYNTCAMTLDCIRSVFSETKSTTFEVIVLDNASTDDSCEAISKEFGNKVKLISSSHNLGFAGGNNRAISDAKGAFLLLLNPDTVILNGAIDRLMCFKDKHPKAGIWGGRTLFADHSLNPASCWSKQTLWSLLSQMFGLSSIFRQSNFFNPEGIGGWDREGQREVDIVSGCFFLISRKLWNQLDGFQADFFMYGEDADLCLRSISFGACPIVTSYATIIHYGSASDAIRADKIVRLLRAKIMLVRRHFHSRSVKIGVIFLASWPLSRYVAHTALLWAGQSSHKNSAQVWREIWTRRNEWL